MCAKIDARITGLLDRPSEGNWPYLFIDATDVNVRDARRIASVAVTVATGVNADGRREVPGVDIKPSEADTFWTECLRKPARRGVQLVVSDAHTGRKAAIAKVLNVTWQRCRVHFVRIALKARRQACQPPGLRPYRHRLRPGRRRAGPAGPFRSKPPRQNPLHQSKRAPNLRSGAAPTSASFLTKTPSPVLLAPYCSNRTTRGPRSAAT